MNKEVEEAIEEIEAIENFGTSGIVPRWKPINILVNHAKNSIPKEKIEKKIEEIEKRINYLRTEITKTIKENETVGTETETDINEQYIYNMEIELERLEYEENILKELLEEK